MEGANASANSGNDANTSSGDDGDGDGDGGGRELGARASNSGGGGGLSVSRLSVWWSDVGVVRGHLKCMLGNKGQLVSRKGFIRAETMAALIEVVRKRFSLPSAARLDLGEV